MKKLFLYILLITPGFLGCHRDRKIVEQLVRTDWSVDVRQGVNDFLIRYANTKNGYVVFDFDNTCSIFDVQEQALIYQIQTMTYAFKPNLLFDVLSSGIGDLNTPRESFSDDGVKHSYSEWIEDIEKAYSYLYETYGPFEGNGVDEAQIEKLHSDAMWVDFATKMRIMYDLIGSEESHDVAYPWVLYHFSGMTEQQVYDMCYKSHSYFKNVDTEKITWKTSGLVESKVGSTSITWTSGIQVSENIVELFKVLDKSGIDVWICSASLTDAIRAAVDVFGLHDYCTGVIAMTVAQEDGVYVPEYDYVSGYEWFATNRGWVRGTSATKAQTQGEGKVTAIRNVLMPAYGNGPLAGFMDSTGDFNFCTEFKNLKLVICFNRADRKVTDGGGLIAELAMYQKETLKYNLNAANNNGDTFYLLQGRDENGLRSLRNSNLSLKYGSSQERLFANENNSICLDYMIEKGLSTRAALEKFARKTPAGEFDFGYGFLTDYVGYHFY